MKTATALLHIALIGAILFLARRELTLTQSAGTDAAVLADFGLAGPPALLPVGDRGQRLSGVIEKLPKDGMAAETDPFSGVRASFAIHSQLASSKVASTSCGPAGISPTKEAVRVPGWRGSWGSARWKLRSGLQPSGSAPGRAWSCSSVSNASPD